MRHKSAEVRAFRGVWKYPSIAKGMATTETGFDLRGETSALQTLLRETWKARGLVRVLARKDFFVRFRRASFGIGWAVALPLLQAAVMAVVLPRIVTFDVPGSFLTFAYAGLTAWSFFSSSLSAGVTSIVEGQGLSTKVYFPRLVLPVVSVLANAFALLPGVGVLVAIAVLGGTASWRLALLVPAVVLLVALAAGFASLLGALQVYFRDVRYIVQAALLAWFYATPVFYPLDAVERLEPWLSVNPMTGLVELFRLATLGTADAPLAALGWSVAWTVALAAASLLVHRRYDRVFVDLL